MTLMKKAVLGTVLGATVLTAAAPAAEAQRYRHYYRGHDGTGTAIVAGIAGLAIGAAIASSSHDRRYDYDRRYYRDHGYYPTDGYYYREQYPRYREYCDVRRVWDPYVGHPVLVRYCR